MSSHYSYYELLSPSKLYTFIYSVYISIHITFQYTFKTHSKLAVEFYRSLKKIYIFGQPTINPLNSMFNYVLCF